MLNNNVPLFVNLPDRAKPFYEDIITMRDKWATLDLIHIVHLSRMLCDLKTYQDEIAAEGLINNGRVNFKIKVTESLHRLVLAYSRLLSIDAASYIGRARDQVNKNRVKRKAIESAKSFNNDELIALPYKKC